MTFDGSHIATQTQHESTMINNTYDITIVFLLKISYIPYVLFPKTMLESITSKLIMSPMGTKHGWGVSQSFLPTTRDELN